MSFDSAQDLAAFRESQGYSFVLGSVKKKCEGAAFGVLRRHDCATSIHSELEDFNLSFRFDHRKQAVAAACLPIRKSRRMTASYSF